MKRFSIALLPIIPAALFAQSVTYTPIPPGFDFPGDQAALLALRDAGDVPGMRKHAWMTFAGMTQATPTGEAIWETWFSAQATFAPGPTPQGVRKVERRFQPPRQLVEARRGRGPKPQAIGASLLSFTLFNQETRQHVRANKLNLSSELTKRNNAFPLSAPPAVRQVPDFPRQAVSLKAVWWIVKQSGLTPMPIWDPENNPALSGGNDFSTWKRVIAVDPSRSTIPATETATVTFLGKSRPNSHVVPLANFYSFAITDDTLPFVRASQATGADQAEVGDFAALLGMHTTTKEIPQWIWNTFWWHDKPNDGPYAGDRPDAVKGVWRNYLMNTTYDMDKPAAADGGPPICFNPWLEAGFPDGVKSNCMSCHQKAVWPKIQFLPITRGSLKPTDPIFRRRMRLDLLWSIAFESQ